MERRVAAFTPRMDSAHWAAIEGFVRSVVVAARPQVPYSTKILLSSLAPYVLWCWQAACVPLTVTDVFDLALIEEWVTSGCPSTWSVSTRATTRSMLRRITEALVPQAPAAISGPISKTVGKAPYTPAEVALIRGWSSAQTTVRKTLDAKAVCALGFGAGLRRDEIIRLRPADVIVDDLGVAVIVTGPAARAVPVVAAWEQELTEATVAAVEADADWLLCPSRRSTDGRLVANFIRNCHPLRPRPDLQKMRSTWLVGHLTAAVPPTALVEAAGVEGLFSLARYLDHVPNLDPDAIRIALRGENR